MAKGKKQEDPNKVAQRKQARVEFVQANPNLAPEVARQRFYVQTRAAELEAAGKDVDRAALRQKFQTGGVTREGFYTPGDVNRFNAASNGSSLADTKGPVVPPVVSNAPVASSATPSPSVTKPTGVKTPSSSYQAPQITTSLGQVVNTAPSGTLAASKNNAGPNVRAGVGTRRVDNSTMASGVPQIAGVTWRSQADLPDAVITSPQRVPTPVKSKTQIRLSGKGGQNLAAWRANQDKWDREEFAADRLVNTGIVMGAEAVGGILGSFGGPQGAVAGAALAAGAAYNITNRLSNWRTEGRYQGDTTLGGAAKVSAVSGIAGGATLGAMSVLPKVGPAWKAVQKWADDTPIQPKTPWMEGGASSPGVSTGIKPRTPWVEGPKTTGVNSSRRVSNPKTTPPKSIEPPAPVSNPKFTPETKTESGLVIPATTNRTPAAERNPVLQKALDDVFGKPAAQPPVSLDDTKASIEAQLAEDGVKTYDQMTTQEKRNFTRAQNKLKLQQRNVEVKAPDTVPAAKPEPAPNVTPKPTVVGDVGDDLAVTSTGIDPLARKPFETNAQYDKRMRQATLKNSGAVTKIDAGMDLPRLTGKDKVVGQVEAGMSRSNRLSFIDDMSGEPRPKFGVVQGESPERLAMMRNHPAFTSKLPEKPANLSEVKEPRPRMRDRFADINDAGEFDAMTPEGYPMSEPGETFRQFNERVNRFQIARGKKPVSQEGQNLSGETPKPKKLDGNVEAKRPTKNSFGQQLKAAKNPKFDPETNEWYNTKVDPDSGEIVFIKPRVKGQQKTGAEKQATRRLNQKGTVEVKQVPEAQKGVFTFAGETIEGTKVVLPRGVSGTGKFIGEGMPAETSILKRTRQEMIDAAKASPGMDVESWVSKDLSPDEQQLFGALREAKGTRASRRVAEPVKGARAVKPGNELASYEQEYISILNDQGEVNMVSFMRSPRQIELEKKIEKAFGTDTMATLRKKYATGADSIPTSGIEMEPAPKSFSEVLPSQLRQELPVKPGANLREQAAELFNAEGLLKGKTGPGRARLWKRVQESQWFRELSAKEPTFAKFLVEKNDTGSNALTEGYKAFSLSEGFGGPRTPRMAGQEQYAKRLSEGEALKRLAMEETRTENLAAGTAAFQRAKETRGATNQLFPGEDAAFGQVNQARMARETGFSMTAEQEAVLKEFGVLDPSGTLQMSYSDVRMAQRELTGPIRGTGMEADLASDQIVAKRAAFVEQFGNEPGKNSVNAKGWAQEQYLQKRNEYFGEMMDAPFTRSLGNSPEPFASRIDPNLVDPNRPVSPEAAENAAKWRDKQDKAARKASSDAAKQQVRKARIEGLREAGLLKETNVDDFLTPRPARKVEPPTLEQMRQNYLLDEAKRRESLARAAAKAKAQSFEVKAPVDPMESLGKFNPQTGYFETDIVLPYGSVTRIQTKATPAPLESKFKFLVEERKFTRIATGKADKETFDAARQEVMKEEQMNAAEILKDWMSGD